MLDEDLAELYGVETKRLIEQVKRNLERFPGDFMFQLDKGEAAALRSQIATSNAGIEIMRAFVELRRVTSSHSALQERLEDLEREMTGRLNQHDEQLGRVTSIEGPGARASASQPIRICCASRQVGLYWRLRWSPE